MSSVREAESAEGRRHANGMDWPGRSLSHHNGGYHADKIGSNGSSVPKNSNLPRSLPAVSGQNGMTGDIERDWQDTYVRACMHARACAHVCACVRPVCSCARALVRVCVYAFPCW